MQYLKLKGDDIAQSGTNHPINAQQGKTAGVQISTTSGGEHLEVPDKSIRGNSTFDQIPHPYLRCDGVILDNVLVVQKWCRLG